MANLMTINLSKTAGASWGFRLQGGKDFATPLCIQKVNVGSVAERAGLQAGDAIVSINNQDALSLRHKEAQDAIVRAGNAIEIVIQRGAQVWKPQVTALPEKTILPDGVPVATKTSLAATPKVMKPIGSGHNTSAAPFGEPRIVNLQYNSPLPLYSEDSIAETLSAQAEMLDKGVLGINFKKYAKEEKIRTDSPVYKLLHGEEEPSAPKTRPPLLESVSHPPYMQEDHTVPQHHDHHAAAPTGDHLQPGENICSGCQRLIVGVFVRIKNKNLHAECFKCATCGSSLKNVGYYNIHDKLYCDIHAKQAARSNPPAPHLEPVTVEPGAHIPPGAVMTAPSGKMKIPTAFQHDHGHVPAPAAVPEPEVPECAPFEMPAPAPESLPEKAFSPIQDENTLPPQEVAESDHKPSDEGVVSETPTQNGVQVEQVGENISEHDLETDFSILAATVDHPEEPFSPAPVHSPIPEEIVNGTDDLGQQPEQNQDFDHHHELLDESGTHTVDHEDKFDHQEAVFSSVVPQVIPEPEPEMTVVTEPESSVKPAELDFHTKSHEPQVVSPPIKFDQLIKSPEPQVVSPLMELDQHIKSPEPQVVSPPMELDQHIKSPEPQHIETKQTEQEPLVQPPEIGPIFKPVEFAPSPKTVEKSGRWDPPVTTDSVGPSDPKGLLWTGNVTSDVSHFESKESRFSETQFSSSTSTTGVHKSAFGSAALEHSPVPAPHHKPFAPAPAPAPVVAAPTKPAHAPAPAPSTFRPAANPQAFGAPAGDVNVRTHIPKKGDAPAPMTFAPAPAPAPVPAPAPMTFAPAPAPAPMTFAPAPAPAPIPKPAPPPSMGPKIGPGGPVRGVPQAPGQRSAPRRGRGVMNQASASRIPMCSICQRQIRGPFVSALGKTWCPDHFVCATSTCKRSIIDMGFVEERGQLYCEVCYENYLAPICGKCDKRVKGDCLNAVGKQFHPECFCCAYCGVVFGSGAFYLEDGLPYCEADWNDLFTTKCVGCNFPIEAGDRWVEALNNNYHSQCFKCSKCHKNLEGQSFFAKGGKPFCKAHAQRGF